MHQQATGTRARMAAPARKRLALVIGAGGVKCAAALGMWKVLHREGIAVDLVVGCSGGSLYASVMALGWTVDECERKTREMWTRDVATSRNWRAIASMLFPRSLGFNERFALVDDRILNDRIAAVFAGRTFSQATLPLFIVATDLYTGEKVVIEEGSLFNAVRSSIAVPYIFPAWHLGGRWLLDGCLADPMPVDVAIREGAEIILAMGFESPYPRELRSAARFAFQVSSIFTNNLFRANYAFHNLAHHAEIIPVIPAFREEINLFDTHKIPYVIEEGERAAEAQLPYLIRLLQTTSHPAG
jgi:NTE family protein